MQHAKRIFIMANLSYGTARIFRDQSHKLAKGFIRLGHDACLFNWEDAILAVTPLKNKSFANYFYKSKARQLLVNQIKAYKPDIIYISFPKTFDAEDIDYIRKAAPESVLIGIDRDPWPKLRTDLRMQAAQKLDILTMTNDGEFLEHYKEAGGPLCTFMPNLCDPDVDHRYDVPEKWKTDILWTGKVEHDARASDIFREEIVQRLAHMKRCSLYGCYGKPKIGGIEYLYAISGARIGLSINAINTVRLYHSDRLINYISCGTFTLAKRVPDSELLFKDGVHLRYFDTADEFFELADWYLKHDQEREKIARAGMEWAHEQFNSVKIAGYTLDIIEKGYYIAPWTG